tara:strand:+ start:527 stop:1759 length:1233 start_codon:yes stop_codon:yes gene_type:complete
MRHGYTFQAAAGGGGGFNAGWTDFTSSTFAVAPYGVHDSGITIHGVVNTNQLVGTMFYTESNGGDLPYYIRGFVLDLSDGSINLGTPVSPYNSGTYGGARYSGSVAAKPGTGEGVTIGVATASYFVRAQGYNITNYSSCNQSTAPSITFGASQDLFTNGNHLGDGCAIRYVNGTRYVATTRGSDANRRRSMTWNGTSLTLEGTLFTIGSSGANFDMAVFEDPGNSLAYGAHHATSDSNANYVNAGHFSSNSVQQIRNDFYSVAKSGVQVRNHLINDVAGANRSLVVATTGTDAFATARVLTTTDFTSTSGSTFGPADTSSTNIGNAALSQGINANEYFAWTLNSSNFYYSPITVSGTTPTWGTASGTVGTYTSAVDFASPLHYTDGTNDWFITAVTTGSAVGAIKAMVKA